MNETSSARLLRLELPREMTCAIAEKKSSRGTKKESTATAAMYAMPDTVRRASVADRRRFIFAIPMFCPNRRQLGDRWFVEIQATTKVCGPQEMTSGSHRRDQLNYKPLDNAISSDSIVAKKRSTRWTEWKHSRHERADKSQTPTPTYVTRDSTEWRTWFF